MIPAIFLFIFFLSQTGAQTWAADSCPKLPALLNQIGHGIGDFPIEKHYPNLKVKVGQIERGSKAFQLWRQRTPPHIPDEAFNWHYYSEEQMLKAGGFPVGKPINAEPAKLINSKLPEPARRQIKEVKSLLQWPLNSRLKASPEILTIRDQILDPAHTQRKLEKFYLGSKDAAKYFITSSGDFYVVTDEEIKALSRAGHQHNYHIDLAELMFGTQGKSSVYVVDYGYLYASPVPGFSSLRHEPVNVMEFIKDVFSVVPKQKVPNNSDLN